MKHLFDRWLEFTSASTTASTRNMRVHQFYNFFDFFKGKSVRQISTNDIAAWMDWLLKKKKLKPSTVIGQVSGAKYFLEWCVDQGELEVNPVALKKLPKIKMNKPDKHPFTWEQYHRVLKAVSHFEHKPWACVWPAAIAVGWHTGMRISDCATLAWANVSFDDRMITVWPKKKESVREQLYIPIEPDLYDLLLTRFNQRKPDAQYVNYELYASYSMGDSALVAQFRLICDYAGLPNHSFHSLRHGFVSRLINAGVDPIIISTMTGQTLEVIQGYSHISTEAKMAALAKSRESQQTTAPAPKLEIAV